MHLLAKIIIYAIIVLWFLGLIILVGVVDTWFNFRKIEKGGKAWK